MVDSSAARFPWRFSRGFRCVAALERREELWNNDNSFSSDELRAGLIGEQPLNARGTRVDARD